MTGNKRLSVLTKKGELQSSRARACARKRPYSLKSERRNERLRFVERRTFVRADRRNANATVGETDNESTRLRPAKCACGRSLIEFVANHFLLAPKNMHERVFDSKKMECALATAQQVCFIDKDEQKNFPILAKSIHKNNAVGLRDRQTRRVGREDDGAQIIAFFAVLKSAHARKCRRRNAKRVAARPLTAASAGFVENLSRLVSELSYK